MDPARVERLRDPKRLETLPPDVVWEVLPPVEEGAIVDIGAGVGYLALPFARRFPRARIVACDILEGMLELLGEAAREEGLANVETVLMEETRVPVEDGAADLVIMAQVHHELNDPEALLKDCHRLLKPGGRLAIIDWKGEETGKGPTRERRVPEAAIEAHIAGAGYREITRHPRFIHHSFFTAVK
jgi:ubiquinone/menaquinone biosynthesis C-methylase UbiE